MRQKCTALFLSLLLVGATSAHGARPTSPPKTAAQPAATILRALAATELAAALAAIEQAVEAKRRSLRVHGAALVIVKDDRVVLLKGFVWRDVKRGWPVTPATLFGIGSGTKTFTALAADVEYGSEAERRRRLWRSA